MNIEKMMEHEEELLYRDYENGLIDEQDYNRAINNLHREARAMLEEEAQSAYDEVMNRY